MIKLGRDDSTKNGWHGTSPRNASLTEALTEAIILDINPSNLPWPIRGGFENASASDNGPRTDGDAP